MYFDRLIVLIDWLIHLLIDCLIEKIGR